MSQGGPSSSPTVAEVDIAAGPLPSQETSFSSMAVTNRPVAVTKSAVAGSSPQQQHAPGVVARWLPTFTAGAAVLLMLWRSGVDVTEIIAYLGFLVLAVTLPGTLLWRVWHRRDVGVGEDLSAGTAFGMAFTVFSYLAALAIGMPGLFVLAPLAVVVTFSVTPSLRRYFRPPHTKRTPLGYSWMLALLITAGIGWLSYQGFLTHPLGGHTAAAYPHVDVPFHLALAGELTNHWPPQLPYIAGEPLHYHWFGHSFLAAGGWATGIELETLLVRFFMPVMVALTMLLTARLAWRMSGRSWTGPAAIVTAFFLGTLNPYRWSQRPAFFEVQGLADWWWESPTQAFGAVLFALVILHVVELLREGEESRGWSDLALVGVLVVALVGAKGTFVPVLVAGLVGVCVVRWLTRRSVGWVAPAAAVLGTVILGLALVVLYRGESDGMVFRPLHNVGRLPVVADSQIGAPFLTMRPWVLVAITVLTLLAWLPRVAGAAGMLPGKRFLRSPELFVIATSLVGVGATLAFTHSGFSEYYFLRSVAPLLGVISVVGLAALLPDRLPRYGKWALAGAVGVGALLAVGVQSAAGATPPYPPEVGGRVVSVALLAVPFVALSAGIAVLGGVLWWMRRRWRWVHGISAAMLVVAVLGFGMPASVEMIKDFAADVSKNGFASRIYNANATPLPTGARSAGRWLRDNSNPDDLVATNSHCGNGGSVDQANGCDNRHFWVSGFSERRVLVEGWGYTQATANGNGSIPFFLIPFANQELLAINDAAFTDPSPDTMRRLRERGVRWLFVDQSVTHSDAIHNFARFRYRDGDCVIYELR